MPSVLQSPGTLTVAAAQRDVRTVYANGAVGQAVSATVWLVASTVADVVGAGAGMLTLFIGGTLIFPVTTLVLRARGGPSSLPRGHPMAGLATQIAFTVPIGLLVALAVATEREAWFFPAALVIVGAHYLPFVFLYGTRLFAALAIVLVGAGVVLALWPVGGTSAGAWLGGVVLAVFAELLRRDGSRRDHAHDQQRPADRGDPLAPRTPAAAAGDRAASSDEPAHVISLGPGESLRLTVYGVVLLFLGMGVFSTVADVDASTAASLGLLAAFVATMAVHELVHGVAFRLAGGSPRFGAGFVLFVPYLSTTSPGDRFTARQLSVIGLAPLVSLSVVTLVGGGVWPSLAPYALVAFVANLTGSVGDIWLVTLLWRFSALPGTTFEDRRTGVAVWTDEDVSSVVTRSGRVVASPAGRFVAHAAIATVAMVVLIVAMGLVAAVLVPGGEAFRIGPAVLPLFERVPSAGGVSFSLNLAAPAVGGLLAAVLLALVTRHRDRPGTPRGHLV